MEAAKRFNVSLQRTTVETCTVTVEAETMKEAAFRAGQATPDWQPKSTTIDLHGVHWRDGGE